MLILHKLSMIIFYVLHIVLSSFIILIFYYSLYS
nr:MAG TPA: hypothetical protein [Caudoviricetes sp.]DAX63299.1 MAG TPA: hypothetical protein [Caudoviricetes sp.]